MRVDVGEIKEKHPEIALQMLFRSISVGVARKDHPLFRGSITAKKYAAYRHVNAFRRRIGRTPIDGELEKLNVRRIVALIVPSIRATTAIPLTDSSGSVFATRAG